MRYFISVWAALTIASLLAPSACAISVLWTKTLTAENGTFNIMVGGDGSVALSDAYRNAKKIYWYDRSGALIQMLTPENSDVRGFVYVSKDEVITTYRRADLQFAMELFQLVNGQIQKSDVISTLGLISNEFKFSYPYLLESKVTGSTYELTLYDLTSSVAPTVVGDAVIGIHGKNLQVRWKSLSTAKYKVQTSTDLVTWTDYTDILDGTGSTLVISIPLPDTSPALYARVIKL